MHLDRLETPALIVQEKTLLANMAAMKNILKDSSLALRPHYKSHKCAPLAHWQLKNGAKGMTCAKLGEAIDLADSGVEDILIANQIVDPKKIRRLAELAGDCRLTVCTDDADNIAALAKAARDTGTVIHCYIEYEIGMERCGVTEPEQVLTLAERIGSEPNLRFDGIQAYAGHISHIASKEERAAMTAENAKKLRDLLALLKQHGMEVQQLSGGSTGTSQLKAAEGLYTELQAGSYLFMDATYRGLNLPFQNSLFVLSTVISQKPGLTVVDAGLKTCGIDQGMPVPAEGTVQRVADSEEHFQLHGYSLPTRVGDRLLLVPAHCCSTVNLHDKIYIVDGDKVIDRLPVTARVCGK